MPPEDQNLVHTLTLDELDITLLQYFGALPPDFPESSYDALPLELYVDDSAISHLRRGDYIIYLPAARVYSPHAGPNPRTVIIYYRDSIPRSYPVSFTLPLQFPHDLQALRVLLDRCKAAHVTVHVVDTGGNLVHSAELPATDWAGGDRIIPMLNSAATGYILDPHRPPATRLPPTVLDLRKSLTEHFDEVADGYWDALVAAVETLGGNCFDDLNDPFLWIDDASLWLVPFGDGVSLTRMADEERQFPLILLLTLKNSPEFYAFPANMLQDVTLHRRGNHYVLIRDTVNDEVMRGSSFLDFFAGVSSALSTSPGLECVLGPELFERYYMEEDGARLSFTTDGARTSFLHLCDGLLHVGKMFSAFSELSIERLLPRVDVALATIVHRSSVLQRLSSPVRTAFEKNDPWWMCTRAGGGGFELAAAESEDPEKNRKLEDTDSLVYLIGTAEARPDDENATPNTIQLRIVAPMSGAPGTTA